MTSDGSVENFSNQHQHLKTEVSDDSLCVSIGNDADSMNVPCNSALGSSLRQETDGDCKFSSQVGQDEKPNLPVELLEMQEPALQSVTGSDSDDSEMVEHDVKVCDICGDAGREDLLAICTKCSDGAEHTYCMWEMLRKVPEGDWLCEECKLAEETEKQKQGSDAEKMNKARQSSLKRHPEIVEMAPSSRKQAHETSFGSLKSSSLTKSPSLSRDSSFKGLDKGKVKQAHQASLGFDSKETARSSTTGSHLQPSKSALLKSNSFNTINPKPRVKLGNEVPQKLKSSKDLDIVEGSARMISKSMSFRSVNSVRSSATDSKVKLLSPKLSQNQEVKGSKQLIERGAFENKSLSKLDRPLGSSVITSSSVSAPKVNQKLTPRGESSIKSFASNNKESEVSQSDSKSGSLLRSKSMMARKVRSVEEKPNQVALKDEPSSTLSRTAEGQSNNLDENLQDGSSWSHESSCQSVKFRESSDNHSMPAEESGHTADLRAVKEEMSKGNSLKAAIEAAILKKPGIFRKKKESNQSEGISGMASSDNSSSNKTRNIVSDEGEDDRQTDLGIDSTNQADIQSGETDLPSKIRDLGFEVKSSHALVPAPVISKTLTVPEHECIWQGAFELRRGGNVFDLYGGVQAHLSTYASPKVLDVVNKFPHKISLDEVPRSSTWPRQFHENGPKEYNIALYFFAKDLESYEKGYKNLLDDMVKRDLALKGSFDGVDFLIFTSTQLPENSKRWNMLFFLWGVFKGRRSSCPDSLKNSNIPGSNTQPMGIISPDKRATSLTGNTDKKVSNFEMNSGQGDCRLDYIPAKSVTGDTLFPSEIRCSCISKEETTLLAYGPDMQKTSPIQATEVTTNGSPSRLFCTDVSCVDEDSSVINAIHPVDHDGDVIMLDRMEVDTDEAITKTNPNNDSVSLGRWQLNNRKRPLLDLEEKAVDESDRYFFPVSRKLNSSNNEDQSQGVPNLELALGAETTSQHKGVEALFAGIVEKNDDAHNADDGVSSSISLSLSFPFPDKE